MTTTTTLPRHICPEYVDLSDLLDALALTDEQREAIHEELSKWCSWGDAAITLTGCGYMVEAIADALPESPDCARTAAALLDGVNYVNLEG